VFWTADGRSSVLTTLPYAGSEVDLMEGVIPRRVSGQDGFGEV
jgi:hypothetical protein